MQSLPSYLTCYNETDVFNEKSIPPSMTKGHKTKAGTWGEIIVLEGHLDYRIFEPMIEVNHLDASHPGVIVPQRLHELSLRGPCRFKIRFYH